MAGDTFNYYTRIRKSPTGITDPIPIPQLKGLFQEDVYWKVFAKFDSLRFAGKHNSVFDILLLAKQTLFDKQLEDLESVQKVIRQGALDLMEKASDNLRRRSGIKGDIKLLDKELRRESIGFSEELFKPLADVMEAHLVIIKESGRPRKFKARQPTCTLYLFYSTTDSLLRGILYPHHLNVHQKNLMDSVAVIQDTAKCLKHSNAGASSQDSERFGLFPYEIVSSAIFNYCIQCNNRVLRLTTLCRTHKAKICMKCWVTTNPEGLKHPCDSIMQEKKCPGCQTPRHHRDFQKASRNDVILCKQCWIFLLEPRARVYPGLLLMSPKTPPQTLGEYNNRATRQMERALNVCKYQSGGRERRYSLETIDWKLFFDYWPIEPNCCCVCQSTQVSMAYSEYICKDHCPICVDCFRYDQCMWNGQVLQRKTRDQPWDMKFTSMTTGTKSR